MVIKIKILLINPPWPGKGIGTRSQNRIIKHRADMYVQYPLMMGYSCARLKQEHKVYYIDSVIDKLNYEETNKKIEKLMPDVVIMESVTPSIIYDYKFLNNVKVITNAKTIVTGPHVTYFGTKCLEECNAIDVIIKAEYDTKILEVVNALNSYKKLNQIKGIAFRFDNKIYDTGRPTFLNNLDLLPFPDRDTIPFYKYGESWYNKKPFINMLTSRGCPYGCTFCISSHVMEGMKWRTRSINNVIDEIKYVIDKYGVKEINIDDPTFTISKERVIEFCNALIKNKIRILWTCNGRVDNVDDEMLKIMRKAGCKMIRYGIESASPKVLASIRKGITIEQMKKAFRLTQKHGILALGGFMFGFLTDTKETIEATIQLAKELKPDLIQASLAMAYPGTKLYEEAKNQGKIIAKNWTDYDMTHGPVIATEDSIYKELDNILSRMYREFYFRPSFFIQTLLNIRRFSDITRICRTFITLVRTTLFYRGS